MSLRAASIAARCSGVITACALRLLAAGSVPGAARAAASRCRPDASATPAGSGGTLPPPRSASAFTRVNGRLVSPRERRPISASPPASVPIRLATNGPLSAERRRGLLAEEVRDAHPEPVGQDVAVRHHHEVRRAVGLRLVVGKVVRPLLVLRQFRRAGERRLQHAAHPRGDDPRPALRLELGQHLGRVRASSPDRPTARPSARCWSAAG